MTPVRLEPAALRSRVKHSTTEPLRSLQLIVTIQGIAKNLKTGKDQMDVILKDFAKAFDKVPFQRLLLKSSFYRICDNILQWISSFLHGRTQQVLVSRDAHQRNWMFYQGFHREQSLVPSFFLFTLTTFPLSANHQRLTCLLTTHSCTGTLRMMGIQPNYMKI